MVPEDNSSVPIQPPSIVGLPTSLSVGNVYESQQGKIIVPTDISHLQNHALAPFPSILVSDVQIIPPKLDSDLKKKKVKTFQCRVEGCNKSFDTQWGLTRYDAVVYFDEIDILAVIPEKNHTNVNFLVVERVFPRNVG